MVQHKKPPPLDRTTLEWLDSLCPLRSPRHGEVMEDIWIQAGKRHLLEKAYSVLEDQESLKDG